MSGPFIRIYEETDRYATINLDHVRRADCQNLKSPIDERSVELTFTNGGYMHLRGRDAARVIAALEQLTSNPNPSRH